MSKKSQLPKSAKTLRIINIVSDIALFLVFVIAIPGVLAVLTAGVVFIFNSTEIFLAGPWNLGSFLAMLAITIPPCYLLFLKSRKKQIYQPLLEVSIVKPLLILTGLHYGLEIVFILLYYILYRIFHFALFSLGFPIFIIILYALYNVFFWKYFKIDFSTYLEPKSTVKETPSSPFHRFNKKPIAQLFYRPFLVKMFFNVLFVILVQDSLLLLIIEGVFCLGVLFMILGIQSRTTHISEFRLTQSIFWIKIAWICQSLILTAYIILNLVIKYQITINIPFYMIIVGLILGKVIWLAFQRQNQPIFAFYSTSFPWKWLGFTSLLMNVLLFASILLLIALITPNFYILTGVSVFFLGALIVENIYFPNQKWVYGGVVAIPLFSVAIFLAFKVFSLPIFFQIAICLGVLYGGTLIYQYQKIITWNILRHIQNGILIVLFFIIGNGFAHLLTQNRLYLNGSPVFTFVVFNILNILFLWYSIYRFYFRPTPPSWLQLTLLVNLGLILIILGLLILPTISLVVIPLGEKLFSFRLFDSLRSRGIFYDLLSRIFADFPIIPNLNQAVPFLFKSDNVLLSLFSLLISFIIAFFIWFSLILIQKKSALLPARVFEIITRILRFMIPNALLTAWMLMSFSFSGVMIGLIFQVLITYRSILRNLKRQVITEPLLRVQFLLGFVFVIVFFMTGIVFFGDYALFFLGDLNPFELFLKWTFIFGVVSLFEFLIFNLFPLHIALDLEYIAIDLAKDAKLDRTVRTINVRYTIQTVLITIIFLSTLCLSIVLSLPNYWAFGKFEVYIFILLVALFWMNRIAHNMNKAKILSPKSTLYVRFVNHIVQILVSVIFVVFIICKSILQERYPWILSGDYLEITLFSFILIPLNLFLLISYLRNRILYILNKLRKSILVFYEVSLMVLSVGSILVCYTIGLNFHPTMVLLALNLMLLSIFGALTFIAFFLPVFKEKLALSRSVLTFLSFACSAGLFYSLFTTNFQVPISLSMILTGFLLELYLHFIPFMKKHIPLKFQRVVDAFLHLYIAAWIIPLEYIYLPTDIPLQWHYLMISIGGLAIMYSSRFSVIQCIKNEYVSSRFGKWLQLLGNECLLVAGLNLIFSIIFALFLRNLRLIWANAPMEILGAILGSFMLLSWGITLVWSRNPNFTEIYPIKAIIIWQKCICWMIGIVFLLIRGLYFVSFHILGIWITGFIFLLCLIHPISQYKSLYPSLSSLFLRVLDGIYGAMTLIISIFFFFLFRQLIPQFIFINLTLTSAISVLFLSFIPVFGKWIPKKPFQVSKALFIGSSGTFLFIQLIIWFSRTIPQITLCLYVLLITAFCMMIPLRNAIFSKKIVFIIEQIIAGCVLLNTAVVCYTGLLNIIPYPLVNALITCVIIILLLLLDYSWRRWYTRLNQIVAVSSILFFVVYSLIYFIIEQILVTTSPNFTIGYQVVYIVSAEILGIFLLISGIIRWNERIDMRLRDLSKPEKSEEKSKILTPYTSDRVLTSKLAQFLVTHQKTIDVIGMSGIFLLVLGLGVNFMISVFPDPLQMIRILLMVGIMGTSYYSGIKTTHRAFYAYFGLYQCLCILFIIFVEFSQFFWLAYIIAIGLAYYSARYVPRSMLVQYIRNCFVFALFFLIGFEALPIYWGLFIAAFLLNLLTPYLHRTFFNLSLLAGSAAYLVFIFLQNVNLPEFTPIISAVAVGMLLEYLFCYTNAYWKWSIFKPIFGFLAFFTWAATYIAYYISFPSLLIKVTPLILLIFAGILIGLYHIPGFVLWKSFYRGLIFLSSFGSFLSFGIVYIFPKLQSPIISSILFAVGISGFVFFYFYKLLNIPVGKPLILTTLLLGTASLAGLSYLLLREPSFWAIRFPNEFAIPIALDLFVFTFYLVIGLVKGHFSRDIWAEGVYAWSFLPLINFILFSRLISGIDQVTAALSFFELKGSYIVAFMLCSLMYLPVVLTKLRKYFHWIIYAFWLEIIAVTYWGAQNLFPARIILQIPFVLLISLIFLAPYFYFTKRWLLLLGIWPILTASNIFFILNLSPLDIKWEIPLAIFILGCSMMIAFNFPYIREKSTIIHTLGVILSFFLIYGGIFATIYSFYFMFFPDIIFSLALTFITMGFPLLTGKYFKLHESWVKGGTAVIISCNVGLILWRLFWLSPHWTIYLGDFKLFGIFFGLAFGFALLLVFQAKSYLPRFLYDPLWVVAALCFGLSTFEFLNTILKLGVWASAGSLLLVTTAFSIPLFRSFKRLVLPILLAAVAMIITEFMLPILNFAESPINPILPFLFYFNFASILNLIYLRLTIRTRLALSSDIQHSWEFYGLFWFVFSLINTTTAILLTTLLPWMEWFDILLFGCGFLMFENLYTQNIIRKKFLFQQISGIQRIVNLIRGIQYGIIYTFTAIFIALNLPDSFFFYLPPQSVMSFRITLLLIILLGFVGIDYLVSHILSPISRRWVTGSVYGLICVSIAIGLALIEIPWYFILLLFNFMSIGTWSLLSRVFPRSGMIILDVVKYGNLIALSAAFFAFWWAEFNLSALLSEMMFYNLFLNLSLSVGIFYICLRLKIIPRWGLWVIQTGLSLLLSITVEEVLRTFTPLTLFFDIMIGCLVLALLNIRNLKYASLVFLFWTVIALAIGTILFEPIYFFFQSHLSPMAVIFFFLVIFGAFETVFLKALATLQWIEPEYRQLLLYTSKTTSNLENPPDSQIGHIPLIKYATVRNNLAQRYYVIWCSFYVILVTIFLNLGWQTLYRVFFTVSVAESVVLWSIGIILLSILFYHILFKYAFEHQIFPSISHYYPTVKQLILFCQFVSLSGFVFLHCWVFFNTSDWVIHGQFEPLFTAMIISLCIITIWMRVNSYKRRLYQVLFELLAFSCAALMFEFLHSDQRSIFLAFTVSLLIFTLFNHRSIRTWWESYLLWGIYIFAFTGFFCEILWRSQQLNPSTNLFNSIVTFLTIFCLLQLGIHGLMAHQLLLKKPKHYADPPESDSKEPITVKELPQKPQSLFLGANLPVYQAKKIFFIELLFESPLFLFQFARLSVDFFKNLYYPPEIFVGLWIIAAIIIITAFFFGYFILILSYAVRSQLWKEKLRLFTVISAIRRSFIVFTYFSVPLVLAGCGAMFPSTYAFPGLRLGIFLFTSDILLFVNIYYLDFKKMKLLPMNLIYTLSFITLILPAAGIGGVVAFLSGQIALGILFFAGFTLLFRLDRFIPSSLAKYLRFILLMMIYGAIIGIVIENVIPVLPLSLGILAITAIFHIGIEIETQKKFLSPIITNLYWIRFISWILNSLLLTINIILFQVLESLALQILLALIILTIMQLYTLYLFGQKRPRIWKLIQKIVGVAIYVEILTVCSYLIIPRMLSIPTDTQLEEICISFFLITVLVAITYTLLLLDRFLIKWITHKMIKIIDLIVAILLIILIVFDISFYLYLTVDFTSIIEPVIPTPPDGVTIKIPLQIVIPMLIFTILLAIGLYFKFKKRTLNQIMYIVISLEIFLVLAGVENYVAILYTFLGFLVAFPFIFYFTQVIQFIIRIWRSIFQFLHQVLQQFLFFLQQVWKLIIQISKAISRWVIRHIRLVVTIIAGICAVILFVFILKFFISGLVFLAIFYFVSPQRQKETTQKNFGMKILYWIAVSVCLFGTLIELIPIKPWIISLYSLVFLGYVIWSVRKSEELYNLSPYWRFGSSLATIIDFIIMIGLIIDAYIFDFIPFL